MTPSLTKKCECRFVGRGPEGHASGSCPNRPAWLVLDEHTSGYYPVCAECRMPEHHIVARILTWDGQEFLDPFGDDDLDTFCQLTQKG